MMNRKTWTVIYSLLAGLGDAVTGLLLMIAPAFTLCLMGIKNIPQQMVFISFTGAFVFGVGFSYLLGLFSLMRRSSWTLLHASWQFTAWIRLVIFTFTSMQILNGNLDPRWVSVPITDLACAVFQLFWLASNRFPTNE